MRADASPGVPAYPDEWEADVVLADGGTLRLRPIRPDDGDALLALFDRLSAETVYLRFFSPLPRLGAGQVERFTHVDYRDRMALVAELGGDIVAVARYDRTKADDEAEVAFTVQDDQQGRGIGTILLEHLAAVARAQGVRRFVASTLAANHRMLGVFRDAGFEVHRTLADGVVDVSFPIEATEAALAAQREREHLAEAASMARLLAPRCIAVVGASREPRTIGHEVFRNLLEGGFTGPVYPVNRAARSVRGVRAYRSVLDVPDEVDLAVVCVPADAVRAVAGECATKGVDGLVVISAGFGETGGAGQEAERDLVTSSRRHGMRLVGPNCMGVVNTSPEVQMNATFSGFAPVPGRVAFASQSGALGIALLGQARDLGLGISSFVSLGNKADVSSNDLLQLWEDDPQTDVILLYLESFGNPRKFARLARRVGRAKPIIAVKAGHSEAGSRAAASHTAALASVDIAVDALFRQAGVIRVDTLEQLFGTAQVLAHQPLPAGRRLAIVSNGGGPGILAADACDAAGLEVPALSARTQAEIRSVAGAGASVSNPVDLLAGATAATYERALTAAMADEAVDAVLVIFTPPLVTEESDVAYAVLAAARGGPEKPLVACFLGEQGIPQALRSEEGERSVPSFAFPEAAVRALGSAADYADWLRRPQGSVPELPGVDAAAARDLIGRRLDDGGGGWIAPEDAAALCACYGIPVVPIRRAERAEAAVACADAIGYPVALKAANPALVHKTDIGAVRLALGSRDEVAEAFRSMYEALGDEMGGAVIQPMIEPGVEIIAGVTHDPAFGPLVLLGMGGIAAELQRDRAVRLVPLSDVDAHGLVRSLRTSPLLFGYRGTPAVAVDALEDVLLRVALLADQVPEVAEMDCNPVIVSPGGAVVVDAKARVAPVPADPGELRRLRAP